MVVNIFRGITRWMVLLSLSGLVLGVVGYASIEWAVQSIEAGGVVDDFAPLIATFVALLVAPVIAALLGVYEAQQATDGRFLVEAAIGSLIGSVLHVVVALTIIGQFTASGTGPALSDVVSIAGLVAVTGVLGATAGGAAFFFVRGESDAAEPTQAKPLPTNTDSSN